MWDFVSFDICYFQQNNTALHYASSSGLRRCVEVRKFIRIVEQMYRKSLSYLKLLNIVCYSKYIVFPISTSTFHFCSCWFFVMPHCSLKMHKNKHHVTVQRRVVITTLPYIWSLKWSFRWVQCSVDRVIDTRVVVRQNDPHPLICRGHLAFLRDT